MNRSAFRFAATALCLAFTAFSASADIKKFKFGEASEIEAAGGITVVYTQGPASLTAETPGSDFSDLKITNDGGALKISRVSMERRRWLGGSSLNIRERDGVKIVKVNGKIMPSYTVRVSLPAVDQLKATQSASIRAENLKTGALSLIASSSADIYATGTSGETSINTSSSAEIDASGLAVAGLTLDASSSSEAEARTQSGAPVLITVSTSAEAEVTLMAAAPVTATSSTSSGLTLSGPCTTATLTSSTSSDIDATSLLCDRVKASASTSSGIEAFARQSITASASTSGDISVTGTPTERNLQETTSGNVSLAALK